MTATEDKLSTNRTEMNNIFPIAEVIQAQLAQVGLNVNVVVLDFAELIDRVYVSKPADFLGAAMGFEATGGSPVIAYGIWAAGWQSGYSTLPSNDEFVGLIEQIVPMNSGPERTEIQQRLCEMIYEAATNLPIVTKGHFIAYRADRITVRLHPADTGADWLRHASEFTVLNPE